MKLIALLFLKSSLVQGMRVCFYLGAACHSQSLYSEIYDKEISCSELPEAASNAQSVIDVGSGDNDNEQEVIFYGTGNCKETPIAAISCRRVCIPNQDDDVIKSYLVWATGEKDKSDKIKKRTPREIEPEIQGLFADKGLDLFGRGVNANSSDLGPAKHYDIGNIRDIGNVAHKDVKQLYPFLMASMFGIVHGAF